MKKKKFISYLFLGLLTVGATGMATSCKDYDDDIDNLQKQNDDLTKQLTTLQDALKQAQADAATAHSQFETVSDATQKYQALSTEIASLAKASDLQSAIDDIKALQSGKASQEDLDALKTKIDGIDASLNTLGSRLDNVESAQKSAEQNIESQQKALDQLKSQLAEYENIFAKSADVQKQVDNLNATISALETTLKSADAANKQELLNQLDQLKSDLAKKANSTDLTNAISALESRLTDASSKNKDELQGQIDKLKEELAQKGNASELAQRIDDLKAQLEEDKKALASASDVKTLQEQMTKANTEINSVNANVNILTVFIKKQLTSLVLRPDMYFGGIEGVNIFSLKAKHEVAHDAYHYFTQDGNIDLSDIGTASYHVNPATADLKDYNIDFYSWEADIKQPATTESAVTRAGLNAITPVYDTYNELTEKNTDALKDGILTVPFKANITACDNALNNSKGIIMSLQMSKAQANGKDTTVNSDYALVVPRHGYELLVADKSFEKKHTDDIAVDYQEPSVQSGHLHRSFGALAWNTTPATHSVLYNGSINISALLATHYINKANVTVKDTAVVAGHNHTAATYKGVGVGGTFGAKDGDGDATVAAADCDVLTDAQFKALGLHYEINIVDYTLGSNGTDESAHIQLSKDANGDIIATPRNVTAEGATIKDKVADKSSVGRTPILCIEVKDSQNRTLTFGYMKLLIVDEVPVNKNLEVGFELPSLYADCNEAMGGVTWSQVEYHIYSNELLNMSKKEFDSKYTFDFDDEAGVENDPTDQTKQNKYRIGYQFIKGAKDWTPRTTANTYGQVWEVWNQGEDQPTLDATTHILRWYFSKNDYFKLYNALKSANGLILDNDGNTYVNKDSITTWVRYKDNATNGDNSIYIRLTIPAGKFHFAAGSTGNQKVLAYWFNLNSKTNATEYKDAHEVRVNVPVPTPGTPGVEETGNPKRLGPDFIFYYDDLLTKTEFIKDLHDFFKNGELTASIKDASHFKNLAKDKITPEFQFTLPNKNLGNATFNADAQGHWTVKGYTGKTYTLGLNAAKNQILIVSGGKAANEPLVILGNDVNGVQSVVQYVEGDDQDDILNYKGHNELAERETFTAYIEIATPDACAPVVYDDQWFNVRFLRPLDFLDPQQEVAKDAPNDWQYINLSKLLSVKDWREYTGDPNNGNRGVERNQQFDFAYYQVKFDADGSKILTDAVLGTNDRNLIVATSGMPNLNDPDNFYGNGSKLDNVSVVPGLELYVVYSQDNGKTWNDNKPTTGSYIVGLKYKNNSGITGNYHWFVPVTMSYVFGQNVKQTKWVTVGLSKSVEQNTAKRR